MLPSGSVLNHVPMFSLSILGKYVHQKRSSSLRDVMVHSYVSMQLSRSIVSLQVFKLGSFAVLGISQSNSSFTNNEVTILERKCWFGVCCVQQQVGCCIAKYGWTSMLLYATRFDEVGPQKFCGWNGMESCWVIGGGWYCCIIGNGMVPATNVLQGGIQSMVCGLLGVLLCWNVGVCNKDGAPLVV